MSNVCTNGRTTRISNILYPIDLIRLSCVYPDAFQTFSLQRKSNNAMFSIDFDGTTNNSY